MKKIIEYALRSKKTGELAGYDANANSPETEGVSISYTLYPYAAYMEDSEIWTIDSPEHAEWVRLNSTEWYNAGKDTPQHGNGFKPNEFEVVKLAKTIAINPVKVKVPSTKELIELKYRKTEPKHADYLLSELKKGREIMFTWYDYNAILLKQKKRKA